MRQANIFIVGAPKAGTTSLYHYLAEHPEVFMSKIKETNYFTYQQIEAQGLYYDATPVRSEKDYCALFAAAQGEKVVGEASVSYLFYPGTAKKIHAYNPDAKIIMVLRNPVERAFSHYLMDQRLGLVDVSFWEIISNPKKYPMHYQQYVQLGDYYEQCQEYIDVFGSENVKIFTYESIKSELESVVKNLYDFIDVDSNYSADITRVHNPYSAPKNALVMYFYKLKSLRGWMRKLLPTKLVQVIRTRLFDFGNKPIISEREQVYLIGYYQEGIDNLSNILNKDLSHWKKVK